VSAQDTGIIFSKQVHRVGPVVATAPASNAIRAARVGFAIDWGLRGHSKERRSARLSAQAQDSRARAPCGRPQP
jgi:hypothetical protein